MRPRSCRWRPSPFVWGPPRPTSTPPWPCIRARRRNSSPCARSGCLPPRRRCRPDRARRGEAGMGRLEDRIVLVTGAGSGIGRAIATLFAGEGAFVYVTDVNGEAAQTVAGEIGKAGGAAVAVTADVSRGQDVAAMFHAVETAQARLDVLVNNAGLNVRSDFRHLSDADWVKIREVNLDGVVRVARDGFALLQASKRGSLVNVASIMAHRGLRQLTAYSATKGAITALTRGLAVEYAPFGIRVNALCPGFVHTALPA